MSQDNPAVQSGHCLSHSQMCVLHVLPCILQTWVGTPGGHLSPQAVAGMMTQPPACKILPVITLGMAAMTASGAEEGDPGAGGLQEGQ